MLLWSRKTKKDGFKVFMCFNSIFKDFEAAFGTSRHTDTALMQVTHDYSLILIRN